MAQSFNSLSGGLVNSLVAGFGNTTSTGIQNIGSGLNASFSINSVLGGAVENVSGYSLNAGQNFLLSQIGSSLGNSATSALTNAVTTQIAAAGINQAIRFVSQAVPNPFLGASNVTTAGLGGQASRATISIPDSISSQLEAADYGGSAFTLSDIVFTLVPANAGAQTQQPSQTAPLVDINTAFNPNVNLSPKALSSLKSQTSYNFPAQGNTVRAFGSGNFYTPATSIPAFNPAKPAW